MTLFIYNCYLKVLKNQDKVDESRYDITFITVSGLCSITYVCLPYAYLQLIQKENVLVTVLVIY